MNRFYPASSERVALVVGHIGCPLGLTVSTTRRCSGPAHDVGRGAGIRFADG